MCCTSDLPSLPDHEEKGAWLLVLVFMCILYVGTVEGSASSGSGSACDRPCQCPVCAVSLGYMLSFTTG